MLAWKSPFEIIFSKPPEVTQLRVFGCLCYMTNTTPHKQKFERRSFSGIFLGYPSDQKGFKVYCMSTHKILISRDIIFHETLFPYHKSFPRHKYCPIDQTLPEQNNDCLSLVPIDHDPVPSEIHSESLILMPVEDSLNLAQAPFSLLDAPSDHESANIPIVVPSCQNRQSIRPRQLPVWMQDYQVYSSCLQSDQSSSSIEHMSFLVQFCQKFKNLTHSNKEPYSFKQANESAEWRQAMQEEIVTLENNHTWDVVDLHAGHRPIGYKWVYKVKCKQDESVERLKARLVAKGYNQIEGMDYFDSFSHVAKVVTVRILLAMAAAKGWNLYQLEINNTFLHGFLDEDMHMDLPQGYNKAASLKVCHLRKSFYGLKRASRQWNLKFTEQITKYGFAQSHHDHCLFTFNKDRYFLALVVYVDDILITRNSDEEIVLMKKFLHDAFTIKNLDLAKFFHGIKIARSEKGMHLCQQKYIWDIISDTNMTQAKVAETLLLADWNPLNEESLSSLILANTGG
ncbi:transmembrane signal receptor [Lithospermum erythrorhizon]|uniref:Transmembrane signal receptor n=1 Tax=Lithospermum erythrorhizon TaxID=34254 RepID=A0AAV3Q465_LITER